MSNTFDKLSVLDSFIEEVNSYLPEIETNLERLVQSPGDMDALEGTYRRTHTIGGAASMMDFPGLAHVAHGMEDILGDAYDGLTALDQLTLSLLQRSLGRLHQLLEGIRNGIDEEAVIAEDDADYTSYRAQAEAASSPAIQQGGGEPYLLADEPVALSEEQSRLPSYALSEPIVTSTPSFDEVLASFRAPSVITGEDIAWPEEPASPAQVEDNTFESPMYPNLDEFKEFSAWDQPPASALDTLVASTRQYTTPSPVSPPTPDYSHTEYVPSTPASAPLEYAQEPTASTTHDYQDPYVDESTGSGHYQAQYPQAQDQYVDERAGYANYQEQYAEQPHHPSEENGFYQHGSFQHDSYDPPGELNTTPYAPQGETIQDRQEPQHEQAALVSSPAVNSVALPQLYAELRQETHSLETQAASLGKTREQLRDAMFVIEEQRQEFKSFLDGSKDALERMETWAGHAMGLNLRNSPEQVRRYLPLSVMWVANSKLKKVFDHLQQITGGVEVTEEQMQTAFQQLNNSMYTWSSSFAQNQAGTPWTTQQEPAWSAWEVQVARDSENMRERVTFERQGDLAALEARLRHEIRHEYQQEESRKQFELEQQLRAELRQEFAQQRPEAGADGGGESRRDTEARIRSEVEIQVRQEFLSQITSADGDLARALHLPPSVPASSAQPPAKSPGLVAEISPSQAVAASQFAIPATPSVQRPSSLASAKTSSYSGDIGEEAAEIFRLEAEEHLQTISTNVASLEKSPTNREYIQGIRRATHTLKGAAAMMGFRAIADLCHISEDLLDTIMEGSMTISSAVLSIILDTAETLDILIVGRDSDPAREEERVHVLQVRYAELLGDQAVALRSVEEEDLDLSDDHHTDAGHTTEVVGEDAGMAGVGNKPRDLSVRVRLQRLDELVNLFGELLVNRSVLEERIRRLVRLVADVAVSSNRLADVGQKLESRFEAATLPSGRSVQVMPGEGHQSQGLNLLPAAGGTSSGKSGPLPSYLSEFDELELDRYTEFHQLARGLSEGISDMATLSAEMDTIIRECESVFSRENRLNTTFQDRLMKARLVPLSSMAPRLYRTARAVALKQGKDFDFLLEGETTEVDRTVYEEIAGPLLHLIRNAVNHAIEKPEVRIRHGKSPKGQIKLSAEYEGNLIVITVRDDGTGIDQEKVRQSAIQRGLIRADQQLNENDLVTLIFHPGFSTAAVLSEESGRGVGLDVVRDSVSRLRGTLVVESTPGQGTAFTMTFPTSLAIQSVMMVVAGGQQFAIPTVHVDSIGRLDNFKRSTMGGQPAISVRNELYPLHMLSMYLSLPDSVIDDKAQILLVNAGGQRVALIVDEIKGKSDIVMKNLGPHLRDVHGMAGATVLGNGHVVLVLEMNALISARAQAYNNAISAGNARRDNANAQAVKQRVDVSAPLRPNVGGGRSTPVAASAPERGKHILVVDDSPSVRRVVSSMLKQHGWDVQMARDGVEALEMISAETPAAVLLDIEMPRMDGYELTSTVRAQEQYRTLPLIVLTSRAASKHQQRAMTLGASAYVVKPYQDEELLNIINDLVYGATRR